MSSSQLQDTQLEGEFWQPASCCRSGDEVLMGTLDRDALWGLWGCPHARWGPTRMSSTPNRGMVPMWQPVSTTKAESPCCRGPFSGRTSAPYFHHHCNGFQWDIKAVLLNSQPHSLPYRHIKPPQPPKPSNKQLSGIGEPSAGFSTCAEGMAWLFALRRKLQL